MARPGEFALWKVMRKSDIKKSIEAGELSRINPQSNYSYIGLSQTREQAVKYAQNHMTKEQYGDDWQDDSGLMEIIFSPKGMTHYGTALADNVRIPMPVLRRHCHKKANEGKWHCLDDLPLDQKIIETGERIVTTKCHELSSTEKERLGKKTSESPEKKQHAAESPSELEELKVADQLGRAWKHQVKPLVLYKVVDKTWVKAHEQLLWKDRKDEDVQKRYKAFLDKCGSVLEENKQFVLAWANDKSDPQVCHHGLKRERGHWSIELSQSKRRAIELAAERSGRRELDPESNQVLAVKFSPEAVADALTQFEQETPQYKPPLVRGANTDIDGDKQMWQYNGPALPLLKADKDGILQVSAWTEKIDA